MSNRLPKIGLRTIKTALAVCVCLLLFTGLEQLGALLASADWGFWSRFGDFLAKQDPIFGCVAAVICMQQTVKNSLHSGFNRLLGTAIGGGVGLLLLAVNQNVLEGKLLILWVCIGIVGAIWLVLLLKRPEACAICCVTFLIILVAVNRDSPYLYAINRILDTAIGIGVSVAVNHLVWLPKHRREENE